jgi:hypothetical protein
MDLTDIIGIATAKGFATYRICAALLSFPLEVAGNMHRIRKRKILHNLRALDRENYVILQLDL